MTDPHVTRRAAGRLWRCRLGGALLAVAGACSSTATVAQTFDFAGEGLVTGPAQSPPVFSELTVLPATTSYTLAGVTGWTLASVFSFDLLTLTGNGAGTFARGLDSFDFTFTSSTATLGAPLDLLYTVSGGTGEFLDAIGSGSSQVLLLGDPFGLPQTPIPFAELGGSFALVTPVPEPETLALLALGLAGLGAYRRRAAVRQRRQDV